VCDLETSRMCAPYIYIYIYDISRLRVKSLYRSRLTDERLQYCLHLYLNNYNKNFRKLLQIRDVMHHLGNKNVNKTSFNYVKFVSLNRSIFDK